ncbi:dihydrolipoyl dehydrogenase [Acholeplasma vituli]|uniref:Dihydrolipoyl dehydrogenase n=1 Tax=Paracholeplasma vituli TaxID=69473 RepID=A0ABT2PUI0_9MOLU|nr:dihydrolipoyl dehydrogenase [Paracholeplasma vituli]MCU0104592.1 dihydrolipoyl dehydrogenase [Paracholeplasma vituli]
MNFDIIILGGGPGGYVAAIKGAQLGFKVALIEKDTVGGVCLNEGCIPTKTLLKSAKVLRLIKNSASYGIKVDVATISYDYQDVLSRKSKVVKTLTEGVKGLLKKNGVTVISGFGEVINRTTVVVNNETYTTKHLILATGASPIIPPIKGLTENLESKYVLTYKGLLDYPTIPKSLVIIGGGVIGVEFAQLFSSFGTKVTILEKQDQILSTIDDEVRQTYQRYLKKDGIEIITKAQVTEIKDHQVSYTLDSETKILESEIVLLSAGMKPNLSAFKALNLETSKQGIRVDDQLKTSLPNVYAIGDVTGQMMLAHAASAAGIVAVEAIAGKSTKFSFNDVPAAIYGFPEIASIGYTEQSLKMSNSLYKSSKFPLLANGRSLAEGNTDGFVKLLFNPETGEILGAHILASNASDLIAEVIVAMKSEATIAEIANAIHLHPSVSETVMESAIGAIHKAIHI